MSLQSENQALKSLARLYSRELYSLKRHNNLWQPMTQAEWDAETERCIEACASGRLEEIQTLPHKRRVAPTLAPAPWDDASTKPTKESFVGDKATTGKAGTTRTTRSLLVVLLLVGLLGITPVLAVLGGVGYLMYSYTQLLNDATKTPTGASEENDELTSSSSTSGAR